MSYDLLSVCMCVQGEMLPHAGFVCVCVQRTHMPYMACRLCVWLFICFCLFFNVFFFLPSCLFAAPVCDDPCTVLNVSQRVQKAAKIKKKAVCKKKKKKKRAIEEQLAFFKPSTPCLCPSSV